MEIGKAQVRGLDSAGRLNSAEEGEGSEIGEETSREFKWNPWMGEGIAGFDDGWAREAGWFRDRERERDLFSSSADVAASVPVSLRRGLHVDAHWNPILPCHQLG